MKYSAASPRLFSLSLKSIFFVLLVISLPFSALHAATSIERVALRDLVDSADSVLIATPSTITNHISAKGNVFTEVILSNVSAVSDGVFKELGRSEKIYIWGGVLDAKGSPAIVGSPGPHTITMVYGTPLLQENVEYLFFMKNNGRDALPFAYDSLGVFEIGRDGSLVSTHGAIFIESNSKDGVEYLVIETPRKNTLPLLDVVSDDVQGVISVNKITVYQDFISVSIDRIRLEITNLLRGTTDPIYKAAETKLNDNFIQ